MQTQTCALSLPTDQIPEVRKIAGQSGLSVVEAMRKSLMVSLPRLREQLSESVVLKPFTAAESRSAFAPDPERDGLEAAMARLQVLPPQERGRRLCNNP